MTIYFIYAKHIFKSSFFIGFILFKLLNHTDFTNTDLNIISLNTVTCFSKLRSLLMFYRLSTFVFSLWIIGTIQVFYVWAEMKDQMVKSTLRPNCFPFSVTNLSNNAKNRSHLNQVTHRKRARYSRFQVQELCFTRLWPTIMHDVLSEE